MAASFNESQKIDYLWKKVGYGVTKTAEPASKEAFNESIPSPLLYRGDLIWTQSGDIPASPPANTTSLVQVYKDGGGGGYSPTVQCTEDLTSPDNQTWKTNSTNWIPTQFGDNYLVQVYAGAANISNPQTAGTKLFGAGSGSDDTWFFDYQSGVLNFNGATIPTAIGTGTANVIYIVGYRYVGEFGVDTTFIGNGTSNVNIASANSNVTISVNGTSNVAVFSNTGAYISGVVSATGNISGDYFIGNGSQLTGVTASSVNANALIGNTLSSNVLFSSLTQVGTLSNVSISGNVTGGNVVTIGLVSATGNITGGNVLTDGLVSATGNGTFGNISTAGTFGSASLSVTGNIQGGNITTTGIANLTTIQGATISLSGTATAGNLATGGTVSSTGNITGGNVLTGGLISATDTGTFGNVATGGYVSATGNVTGSYLIASSGFQSPAVTITSTTANAGISLVTNGTGNINVNTSFINNVKDPEQAQDAATKSYVDAVAQGLDLKASVHAATYVALPAYVYNNGTSGVGATLTGNVAGNLTIDGEIVSSGQRVLVKNETGAFVDDSTPSAAFNGIYVVTTAGAPGTAYVLTRAVDFDIPAEMYSAFTFVETGNAQADTGWVCTNNAANPITVGTTSITWTQFSGAGQYTAGNALSLNGTQFNVNTDGSANATIGINGNNQLIIPASAVLTTPNIGAATGTSLTATGNVDAGNVVTGGSVSATGTGTFGNVNTGGTISAAGNIIGTTFTGNVAATTVSASGNITGGNLATGGTISSTGTATLGNVDTGGTVSSTGNITGGNVLTGGTVSSTGNITGGNVLTGGTVSATGNGTFGNISTAGTFEAASLSASGNITGGNITTAGIANLTTIQGATLTTTGTADVGNLTTGGLISATGTATVGNLLTSGIVSAVGNIIGNNFIGLNSSLTGNIAIGGGINLANSFGTLGQVLTATGANGATWSSQFYMGNAPPQAQSIAPNYGDIWYYVPDEGVATLYIWLTDGSSDYFFDLLPPVFE